MLLQNKRPLPDSDKQVLLKQENGKSLIGHEISPAIVSAAASLGKEIDELNIITTAIYRKKGVQNNEQTPATNS